MKSHHYNVDVAWESSRKGMICSPELNKKKGFCIEVATPPDFPEGIEVVWSPEHLLVAAVSGCLMTTFLAISENSTLGFKSFRCQACGKLAKVAGKLIMSEIHLVPTVVIDNELNINKAMRILKMAEDACLIAHSIKSKITMDIHIEVSPLLIESE